MDDFLEIAHSNFISTVSDSKSRNPCFSCLDEEPICTCSVFFNTDSPHIGIVVFYISSTSFNRNKSHRTISLQHPVILLRFVIHSRIIHFQAFVFKKTSAEFICYDHRMIAKLLKCICHHKCSERSIRLCMSCHIESCR